MLGRGVSVPAGILLNSMVVEFSLGLHGLERLFGRPVSVGDTD